MKKKNSPSPSNGAHDLVARRPADGERVVDHCGTPSQAGPTDGVGSHDLQNDVVVGSRRRAGHCHAELDVGAYHIRRAVLREGEARLRVADHRRVCREGFLRAYCIMRVSSC